MKYLSFLLASISFFLAVKPGVDLLSWQTHTEQSCCGGTCAPGTEEESQEDRDCHGKLCNPFQVCCSCALICMNMPYDGILKPGVLSEKGFTYHSVFRSQFVSDFWQPPKIV